MQILLDETKLKLLLERKKQFIGRKVVWDSVLSAFSFLLSVILASYDTVFRIPGLVLKTVFVLLGLFFTAKSIYDVYWSKKNVYTHEDLYNDINALNEITHKHSIVALKDTFNEFPNRFLVYYDIRWKCDLFINFKDHINNESFIKSGISNQLKIKEADITVTYLTQKIHEKFSESHGEKKVYQHRLFTAACASMPELLKQDQFEIDGVKYRWMSIADMEKDDRIMSVNSDIVQLVKENCN